MTPRKPATIGITLPNGISIDAPDLGDTLTAHLQTRGAVVTEWVFMTAAQNTLRDQPGVTAVEGWVTGTSRVALLVRATRRPAGMVADYAVVGAARIVSPVRPLQPDA